MRCRISLPTSLAAREPTIFKLRLLLLLFGIVLVTGWYPNLRPIENIRSAVIVPVDRVPRLNIQPVFSMGRKFGYSRSISIRAMASSGPDAHSLHPIPQIPRIWILDLGFGFWD